jgi:deoxyribonuclease V
MVGCAVVLNWPELDVVEEVAVTDKVSFPYVPGLLSFREAPVLLRAFRRLRHEPAVLFIDGHGLSHPRRFGVACHLGLFLDKPVIGCAKSRLTGAYREPARPRSSESALTDSKVDVIGAVVRSRANVRPIFVSVGHRIGLREAVRLTLACTKGFRIPEPIRQADLLAERVKREGNGA